MKLISRDELKEKIDRADNFRLIFVLGDFYFRAKHIPESINISSPDDLSAKELNKDDDIIVYCSNVDCLASPFAYNLLIKNGFTKVRRYAGGMDEWDEAGFSFEGEAVK